MGQAVVSPVQVEPVFERFSRRAMLIALAFVGVYLAWVLSVVGLTKDHLYLVGLILTLGFWNKSSRGLLMGFAPFFLYVILYDSMRALPNYLLNPVHIFEPYQWELSWFGIPGPDGLMTPNEVLANYTHPWMDVIGGLLYLSWVPLPVAFAIFLFFRNRPLMFEFMMTFLMVNVIGIVIYYLYPAAPPWYVDLYGFEFRENIMGNAAGLARFDAIAGVSLFENMYSKNANVFAAIPSLHAAFPLVLTYYGWKNKSQWTTLFFGSTAAGIWLSAVYSYHHYIVDLIVGGGCALAAIFFMESLIQHKGFQAWKNNYVHQRMYHSLNR